MPSHRRKALALIAGAVFAAACNGDPERDPPNSPSGALSSEQIARVDAARIQGAEDAPVWVVEISDFQCPYCAVWHATTYPELQRDYVATGKVRFAYINLPLRTHQHAWPAAESAMCAGLQDRFWPVHHGIFETQNRWSSLPDAQPVFDSVAAASGVEMLSWRQCVTTRLMRPMVQGDYERSAASGVTSTPSFLIMGDAAYPDLEPAAIVGAQQIGAFRQILDPMLEQAGRAGPERSASP